VRTCLSREFAFLRREAAEILLFTGQSVDRSLDGRPFALQPLDRLPYLGQGSTGGHFTTSSGRNRGPPRARSRAGVGGRENERGRGRFCRAGGLNSERAARRAERYGLELYAALSGADTAGCKEESLL
jgi:hypothetical protein